MKRKEKNKQPTAKEIKAIREYIRYNLDVTLHNKYEFYKETERQIKVNKGKNLKLSDYDRLVKKGYDLYVKKYIPAKDRKYINDAVIRSVSKSLHEYWAETVSFDKKNKELKS